MVRATILSMAVIAVLGMAGLANAAVDWDGPNADVPGYVGDGWDFNNGYNWDDDVNPSGNGWNIFRRTYAPYPLPMNLDIHVTSDITTSGGTIYNVAGYTYTVKLTVDTGVTMNNGTGGTSPGGLNYYSAGLFTVKSGALFDMRWGQLALEHGSLTVVIEQDGELYCSTVRHNNGAMVDVYGTLRGWKVSRISAEGTYRLAVYNGGLFRLDSAVDIPATGGWSDGGKVTQYIGSTVMLAGDQTGRYLDLVQAGEDGVWDVQYDGAYTYITLKYNPCNLIVFADADEDGDVDQADFAMFQVCFTGEGGGVPTDPDFCQCFDRRNNDNTSGQDNDVDGFDLEAFEDCAGGPGVAVDPACDD